MDTLILNQIPRGKIRCEWSNGKTENVTPAKLQQKALRSRVRSDQAEKLKGVQVAEGLGVN